MQAPQGVVEGLSNIRPSFNLVWNPTARVVGGYSFDVNGNPRHVEHSPRWELWDRDGSGIAYKVMTLEDRHGNFLPADQRLVEFVRLIDPARYNGSVEKMIQSLVDDENEYVERLREDDFERLIDSLANYFTPAKGNSMVTVR
jgi:hypothetical protein